jgi:hypothetical protein
MGNDEVILECLEAADQVASENLEVYFNRLVEAIKANKGLSDQKASLEICQALKDVVIARRRNKLLAILKEIPLRNEEVKKIFCS